MESPRMLNLGSGRKKLPGYVNIDIDPADHPDMVLDLENALPFDNESVVEILSSHNIEHIVKHRKYLRECWRVLIPGGVLKLSTPNHASLGMRIALLVGNDAAFADYNHVRCFSYRMIVDEIRKAGFAIKSITGKSRYLFFLPARLKGEITIVAVKTAEPESVQPGKDPNKY